MDIALGERQRRGEGRCDEVDDGTNAEEKRGAAFATQYGQTKVYW